MAHKQHSPLWHTPYTLKDLPRVIKEAKEKGYTLTKANVYLCGRQAYKVTNPGDNFEALFADYDLILWWHC